MKPPAELTPQQRKAVVYRAATLAVELLRYAEALESDLFTPEERNHFRALAGSARVFALAEALRPLCSPAAHALNRARKTGVALTLVHSRPRSTKTTYFQHARTNQAEHRRDK